MRGMGGPCRTVKRYGHEKQLKNLQLKQRMRGIGGPGIGGPCHAAAFGDLAMGFGGPRRGGVAYLFRILYHALGLGGLRGPRRAAIYTLWRCQ